MRFAVCAVLAILAGGCIHGPAETARPRVADDVKGFSKEQKIRKLLDLMHADQMSKQVMDRMMSQFEMMPNLQPGFLAKFRELAMSDDLISRIVPVYARHMQESDVDAAIVFYESPEGKRMADAQPLIASESMSIGQEWGLDLMRRTMRALEDERNKKENFQ